MPTIKTVAFVLFTLMSAVFSAAIPVAFKPYSFADVVLLASSPLLIIYCNKKIFIVVLFGLVGFIMSTLFGSLRGFNTSEITSISLIAKWAGVLMIYFVIINNVKPTLNILKFVTFLQCIVLMSVVLNVKPFPESYYDGSSGIFQASADGGYFILCLLGAFLHISKINQSKLVYFNIVISILSLIFIDSRFGLVLGFLVIFYSLIAISGARGILISTFFILVTMYTFDLIALPQKLAALLSREGGVENLLYDDISLLIRFNNFTEAFHMSDCWTIFIGNGGKFFQLTSGFFYFDNSSLDNSYLYIILSFGLLGIFIFYFVFISSIGLGLCHRGVFGFVTLVFPLMQDIFSNSFNLLTLAIIVAIDTILMKYSLDVKQAECLKC